MDNAVISSSTIAKRCNGDNRLLKELTTVDWVVLDFVDGKRSFQELAQLLPTEQSALTISFRHLKLLGFLTWDTAANKEDPMNTTSFGRSGAPVSTGGCKY